MNDINVYIGLAAILITVVIAYHIAYKQGAFKNSRLLLSLGLCEEYKDFKNPLWAFFIGIPKKKNVQGYILTLPITVYNRGRYSITDVHLQLSMPKRMVVTDEYYASVSKSKFFKENRTIRPWNTHVIIDYEIPIIRPNDRHVVQELVLFDPKLIYDVDLDHNRFKQKGEIEEIEFSVISATKKRVSHSAYLTGIYSSSIDDLSEMVSFSSIELFKKSNANIRYVRPNSKIIMGPKTLINRKYARLYQYTFPESKSGYAIDLFHNSDIIKVDMTVFPVQTI